MTGLAAYQRNHLIHIMNPLRSVRAFCIFALTGRVSRGMVDAPPSVAFGIFCTLLSSLFEKREKDPVVTENNQYSLVENSKSIFGNIKNMDSKRIDFASVWIC